jgi:hypothetical protein
VYVYNIHSKISPFFLYKSFEELWKGRESFTDKKSRAEAIAVLKKMIESWLEDFYPKMPINERRKIAEAMDMTLIENRKEESVKSVFSTTEAIRMGFIEMQYMKKVRPQCCIKHIVINRCTYPLILFIIGNDECSTSNG